MILKKKISPPAKVVFGFVILLLIGTFLLCLPISSKNGNGLSFVDSLFTSASAVSVTGLTVVDTAMHFSIFGQIVILFLIQMGGLGFITLTALVFLLLGKKISYEKRLTIQESLNQESVQGIVKLVKNIIFLVFSIELLGFLFLMPSMIKLFGVAQGIFKALFTTISAFCNAGFDVFGANILGESLSLSNFAESILVLLPTAFLIVLGGVGYKVLFDFAKPFKRRSMAFHSKIVLSLTFIFILLGTIAFSIFEWNNVKTIGNMPTLYKILNSAFQSITTRTAGFNSISIQNLTPASIVLTTIFMFVGAGPASTAGGIKLTTLFVLMLFIFKRTNKSGDILFCKRTINSKTIYKCIKIFFVAVFLILVSTLLICIFENGECSPLECFFECVSAISTTGLSLGITSNLCALSKIILVLLMFVGRVGAVTLSIVLFNNAQTIKNDILYRDSKIMVG